MVARHVLDLARRLVCGAAIAGTVAAGTARAAPAKRPILVFEAHVGPRTEEAARVLGPLRDALESHGFAARPESILKIAGGRAPRAGLMDAGITAATIAQRVDDGYVEYTQSNFAQAIETLNDAIKLIQRNPGAVAFDTSNAKMVFKAYVGLANSHARLGHAAEAVAAMTELIRMYPSVPVTRATYGPEADHIHRGVTKQIRAMGRGDLSITTGHPQAMIFVDNQLRGIGAARLGDMIPGLYRVFVQVPGSGGRQYEVEVRSDDESVLEIAWSVDSLLVIDESYEDPSRKLGKYYWDTAPHGIAVGAIGLASIGFGIWWSYRMRSSSAPVVSVGSSHATVAWRIGW